MKPFLSFFLPLIFLTCLEVSGMSCGNCVKKIKDKFDGKMGISRTQVSLTAATVTFHSPKAFSPEETKKILVELSSLGYQGHVVPCASSL